MAQTQEKGAYYLPLVCMTMAFYLIKDLTVDHKDQVWCSDITCIYTTEGILYVSAMMDIFSRKIISFNIE